MRVERWRFTLVILALLPLVASCSQAVVIGGSVNLSMPTVGKYEKFETTLTVNADFMNPFDPDDIRVDVTFSAPSGRKLLVPAFYYRDFTFRIKDSSEVIMPTGGDTWRVRFTPDELGTWQYATQITTFGKTTSGDAASFKVIDSKQHGFLRVSQRDGRYLDFEDGSPFMMIGLNMAWYNDGRMADYQDWLPPFAAAGGNAIRVWMPSWGFGIEWKDTGLGNYTVRQDRSYELDKLFEMAEAQGQYVTLSLINHGPFSLSVDPEWSTNPYNAANGGPLADPAAFATDPQAVRLWHQRLRYIAARWGYSTHLMAWEWWNEINWTPLSSPDLLAPWIEQSAAYLKAVDPYAHLITHSGSALTDRKVWDQSSLAITQAHFYEAHDWARELVQAAQQWSSTYKKPFMIGEFGYKKPPELDPLGIRLHLGLWAGPMAGSLGTGQFWWWDKYIYPTHQYQHYKGVSAFFAGEDLAAHRYNPTTAKLSATTNADLYGLQAHDAALLWLVSKHYSDGEYQRLADANQTANTKNPLQVTFPDVSGLSLTVSGLDDGQYTVEWWDTQAAERKSTVQAASRGGKLKLDVPTFQTDLALKIKRRA